MYTFPPCSATKRRPLPSPAFVTARGLPGTVVTRLNPTATRLGSQPAGAGVGVDDGGTGVTIAVGAGVGAGGSVGGTVGRGVGLRVGVAVAVGPLVGAPDGLVLAPGDPLGEVDGEWDGARVAVGRGDGEAEARAARDGDVVPDGTPQSGGAGVVPHAATATDTTAVSRRRRTDAPSITRRI